MQHAVIGQRLQQRGLALLLVALWLPARANAAEFLPLHFEETSLGRFDPNVLSHDGTILIGRRSRIVDDKFVEHPAIWTREGGVESPYERAPFNSHLRDVAADSETMIGLVIQDTHPTVRPFKIVGDSTIFLDPPAGHALAYALHLSGDGRIVVGGTGQRPGYWDSEGNFSFMDRSGFTGSVVPTGVSYDGSVIIGRANAKAWYWTQETGIQILPPLDSDTRTRAFDVSGDGRWIVGYSAPSDNAHERQAVRWEGVTDPVHLSSAYDGWGSRALEVSHDRRIIAGEMMPTETHTMAALWTEETGFVPLHELLADRHGLADEVAGWQLMNLRGMSVDGRVIWGSGRNPQGIGQCFLVDFGPTGILLGDYNANGLVEQADLDLVLGHWGGEAANVPPTWINDLPTGNIDQDELDKVLSGWGGTLLNTAASSTVPEPSTAWFSIVAIGAVVTVWSRLRFRGACRRTSV